MLMIWQLGLKSMGLFFSFYITEYSEWVQMVPEIYFFLFYFRMDMLSGYSFPSILFCKTSRRSFINL